MNEVGFVKLDTMTEREREGGGCGGCLGEKTGDGGWGCGCKGVLLWYFHKRTIKGFCRRSMISPIRSVY